MMIPVNGRGLKAGRVTVMPTAKGVVIRVDDDGRPEFWLEITFTPDRLRSLLQLVESAQAGDLDLPDPPDTLPLPERPWIL